MNTITADRIEPAIPTLNVDLLLRVADTIAKHPEAFDMGEWDCGTAACIAGWALRLSGKRWGYGKAGHYTSVDAAHLLGLDAGVASNLFLRCNWPEEFNARCYEADKVGTTIARIHHFIRTGL